MKKTKIVMKRRLKVAIVLFLLGYFGFILIEQEIALNDQRFEIERLTHEIAASEKQNEEIERMIEYTDTLEFIESAAREYFGWVKEGEIKFIEKETENR